MNPARTAGERGTSDAGWYMDRIGMVDVVLVHGKLTQASFDHLLAAMCRSIDERGDDEQVAALYEVPEPALMESAWRKRMAEALKEREDKLARTCPGYAMTTRSVVVRAALKVMYWIAPPPYPNTIVGTVREACEFLGRCVPGLDARALEAEYVERRAAVMATASHG